MMIHDIYMDGRVIEQIATPRKHGQLRLVKLKVLNYEIEYIAPYVTVLRSKRRT